MQTSGIRMMVVVALSISALTLASSTPAGADGNEAPDAPPAYRSLSAGPFHSCAIGLDGTVRCWGRNLFGELGQGDTDGRGDGPGELGDGLPVVNLGAGRTATAISATNGSTCAVLDNGEVKCWGGNAAGNLGLGDTLERGDSPGEMGDALPPVDLGLGRTATAITAAGLHTCAVLDTGQVKCWGANSNGQLGVGDTITRGDGPDEMGDALPAVDLGPGRTATAITAGSAHSCALLDTGQVKCWGDNGAGQLGQGDTDGRGDGPGELGDALPAVNLGTGRTAVAVSAGGSSTCALLDNGQLKCWGFNGSGALGYGDTTARGGGPGEMGNALAAVDLGTDRTATGVSTSGVHTCAVLDGGAVKCWGANGNGQLGLGDTDFRADDPGEMGDALLSVDLGFGRTATAVTTSDTHTCASLSDATVRCWGDNANGQLGQGDLARRGDGPGELGDALAPIDLPTPNDDFADARPLTGLAGTVTGANPNTDKQPGEPDHNGFPFANSTIWYQWTSPVTGPVRIDTLGSTFDTVLAAYTGTDISALTPIAANDDAPGVLQSQIRFRATTGTTYAIAIAGFNGVTGPTTLTWRQIPPCDGRTVTVARAFGDTPTTGNDVIAGTTAAETIDGRGGNDRICGLGGTDTLIGGGGTDRLLGGPGNDTLRGSLGNDTLQGGTDNDRLLGETGNDRLNGGSGRDACNGGPQRDTATACETRTAIP